MDHDLAVKSQACEKYLLGELSPDLRDAYEEHYFSCAECATELRMVAALVGAGQQILHKRLHRRLRRTLAQRRNLLAVGCWLRPDRYPRPGNLLLIVGYQNLVIIPQLRIAPSVLPMFSLISRTPAAKQPEFTTQPNNPWGCTWMCQPTLPLHLPNKSVDPRETTPPFAMPSAKRKCWSSIRVRRGTML
jgi:hypothetical protein